LFFLILGLVAYLLIAKVILPLLVVIGVRNGESTEELAFKITTELPEINDDLINYLQLEKNQENDLAKASLEQRLSHLFPIDFSKAIDKKTNRKYARALACLVVLFLIVAFINPPVITGGAERLVNFNKEFVKPAPFSFVVLNDSLKGFQNKDFTLAVELSGQNIPGEAFLIIDQKKMKLDRNVKGGFSHTFKKLNADVSFQIEASGFRSKSYQIELLNKPQLDLFKITVKPPAYTKIPNRTINNTGNLEAPAGSVVTWTIQTSHSNTAVFEFRNDSIQAKRINQSNFELSKKITESGLYRIRLENQYASNESKLDYRINVVPDESPVIKVDFLPDTSYFKFVVATGEIQDDYGFKSLDLVWEIDGSKFRKPVDINQNAKNQRFYAEWFADSADVSNKNILFYLVVRDNDQPAGFKSSKSSAFSFRKPDFQELSAIIEKKSQGAEKQMNKSSDELEKLKEMLEKLSDRLKAEKDINWQEEKLLEETIEQRKEIEKMLEEMKEKHDDLIKANDNFEQTEQLKEKSQKLNELMESLMDDETKKLYEELQKLLEDKASSDELREKLEQISRQENRMQKDLERTKELFKRFKLEAGLQRVSQQLDSLAQDQLKLSEDQTKNDSSALADQQNIKEQFDELSEDLERLEELNQDLDKPEPLEDFDSDKKQVSEEMKDAMEEMTPDGDKKKSKKSQQNAAQQMQKMSEKMQKMQAGMEMEVMQENIEQLRKILDDLVKLSFNQEELIADFRTVNSSDPRFITLSQSQIKLQEDMVVIEDSLLALAGRVVQLSSFITKEIEQIDFQMKSAVEQIRERQRGRGLSHQQFSMTSMNNLALLLNDVLQQMQMTMSEANGKSSQNQPQQSPLPKLGEMQQQLGEQIQKLQDGQKSGQQLSEELARMAAEQEMIRRQLEQLQEQMEGQFGNQLGDELKKAIQMMEDNEVDLVNKKITRQLMLRQKEITTRMLEAEEALKEQEQDPEREGETSKQRERLFPPNFEEYLNERKKEIELLRSVPIELNPFYKKEVNDYFRRLSESN
ncbi:MAG: DUF4175 family protein, partial [Cyclobacteriaceae bacterium]